MKLINQYIFVHIFAETCDYLYTQVIFLLTKTDINFIIHKDAFKIRDGELKLGYDYAINSLDGFENILKYLWFTNLYNFEFKAMKLSNMINFYVKDTKFDVNLKKELYDATLDISFDVYKPFYIDEDYVVHFKFEEESLNAMYLIDNFYVNDDFTLENQDDISFKITYFYSSYSPFHYKDFTFEVNSSWPELEYLEFDSFSIFASSDLES